MNHNKPGRSRYAEQKNTGSPVPLGHNGMSARGFLRPASGTGHAGGSQPDRRGKRFRQLEQRKLLRVAVSTTGGDFAYLTQDGIFEGQEVKAVLNAAHRNGWSVFFFASRPESLAAYVRSGRADLALGGLSPEAIRTARLTPVMEYSLDKKRHAFASWNDAVELKERLESGTIPTKSDSQLEKTTLQE